jgi:cytochrome b involved in lipid metabolism
MKVLVTWGENNLGTPPHSTKRRVATLTYTYPYRPRVSPYPPYQTLSTFASYPESVSCHVHLKQQIPRPSHLTIAASYDHTITMSEQLTTKQVAEHNTVEKGLYIIVDKDVYKLDSFVEEHPGGAKILKRVGGKDASKQFWKVCKDVCHVYSCGVSGMVPSR